MKKLLLIIGIGLFFGSSYAQDMADKKEDVFKGIKKVMIDADFCTLKMIGHDSNDVVFNGILESNENNEAYHFEILQQQDTLRINVIKPENWISHWGELTLMLPIGLNVEVTTQSGKVEAKGLKEVNLNIVSKSGHVYLTDLQGNTSVDTPVGNLTVNNFTGELKSRTKTGTVHVKMLTGNADIGCNKGLISISDVKGKLFVDGGEGNLEVEKAEGDITLKSTSGSTKISIASGNIICKSFNGDMKLFNTTGVYEIQTSTGNIVGTRVGLNASSTFTTTEGNIKMQLDTKDNLMFELNSDNAYLRAMEKSKKKSLKIGKGEIVITGTSTTGSQAYY